MVCCSSHLFKLLHQLLKYQRVHNDHASYSFDFLLYSAGWCVGVGMLFVRFHSILYCLLYCRAITLQLNLVYLLLIHIFFIISYFYFGSYVELLPICLFTFLKILKDFFYLLEHLFDYSLGIAMLLYTFFAYFSSYFVQSFASPSTVKSQTSEFF